MHTVVYAHGFKSSSQSRKAIQLKTYLQNHHADVQFLAPDLNFRPARAIAQLREICARIPASQLTLIGSSLGGFYATALAEQFSCRAVLLNPSIRPFETLANHLGEQTNIYTQETFVFDQSHIVELQAMHVAAITRPDRYLLVVEMGDELLDHNKTIARFAGARHIVIDGGDHELKSFPAHIPAVMDFVKTTQ